jgi:hypothetical protein
MNNLQTAVKEALKDPIEENSSNAYRSGKTVWSGVLFQKETTLKILI